VDGRVSRPLAGRQTLTFGGEFRRNFKQDQGAYYDDELSPTLFIRESSHTTGIYVQDEIALNAQFLVTGGFRFDHYADFSRLTPRAALIFKPTPNRAIKYLFGRAFRAPNRYELDYYLELQRALTAETVDSHELIWEEYAGSWLRTSVSGYLNHVEDLIRLEALSPDELFFVNGGHVDAVGAEVEAEVRTRNGVHALGSYSLQRARNEEAGQLLTNSPRHVLKGRLILPTVRAGASLAVEIERLSARKTLGGAQVDAATLVGLNVVEPLGRSVALTARIRNVLNRRYWDPGSEEHVQDAIEQNGRTVTVGVRWSLK
jgi:iron complex outermembrane receptor protein